MMDNPSVQSISSGSVATISLLDGTSVAFEGNFIDKDSVAYSGRVYVELLGLDPAEESFEKKLPGMLYGENSLGQEHILESYGTLAIELKAEDGKLLYLAKDSPVEITIPMNTSLQNAAPTTIPLWYFDYENGYWIEDGDATLLGDKYKGTINHVSYWNFSTSSKLINLNFKFSDEDEKAIANQKFNLKNTNTTYPYNIREFITNSDGAYNCIVPANRILDLKVYNNSVCGNNLIYDDEGVNTSFADRDVNVVIVADAIEALTTTISGVINDCNNDPILNGYVFLNSNGEQYFDLLNDGNYDLNMLHCDTETTFSVTSFDYDNSQRLGEINYFFTNPITYLGELVACNTVNEIIQYSIDEGNEKVLITNGVFVRFNPFNSAYNAPSITIFELGGSSGFNLFGLLNANPYLGVYANYEIGNLTQRGMNIGQSIDVSDTNNNITFNLVKLGDIGEYIDIHFAGDYQDASGASHNIVGVVHVFRDE